VRGPLNAGLFELLDGYMHRKLGERKSELFADLPEEVLELGCGTGANLRYLDPGTRLIGVEPNAHMHGPLRKNAENRGVELDLLKAHGERIPLEDQRVRAVISTLVLCTVRDPRAVLAEVLRLLAPGGRFLCIAHVRAEPGSVVSGVQRALSRPWSWFFEGCDTRRDLESAIADAGFSSVSVERFTLPTVFVPVRPMIRVTAVK